MNRRNGAVLAERIERATRLWERMRGLLGRRELREGDGLAIEPCTSIHTFFMGFPIDAAFLDRNGRVIRAIPHLRPFRATRVYPSATQVVELPAGRLARTETREGDSLSFENDAEEPATGGARSAEHV
ncbi:MAG: DUF192 domain-containing protein [Myxococcales bacterium]